jgi:hypothetical protein
MICSLCSTPNPDGAKFCSHCGIEIPPPGWSLPSSKNQPPGAPRKSPLNWLADASLWNVTAVSLLAVSVSLLGMLVIGSIMRDPIALQSSPPPTFSPTPPPAPISPADYLAIAKNAMNGPYDVELYQAAIRRLSWIAKDDKEYPEAQALQQRLADEYRRREGPKPGLTPAFNIVSPAGGSTTDEVNRREGLVARPEDPPILRMRLRDSYEFLIKGAKPNYRFIKVQCVKSIGGYTLWATHDDFSQFSFDLGSFARAVQDWISEYRSDLVRADVKRVGVRDDGPFGSSIWFDIEP